jgi:hypothetical protein
VNRMLPPKPLPQPRQAGINRRNVTGSNSEKADPAACVPRISRLMALAIRFDAMLKRREVRSLAELARLGQVSRARITQIMNLLNLSPAIQERILLPRTSDSVSELRERNLRQLTQVWDFEEQDQLLEVILRAGAPEHRG